MRLRLLLLLIPISLILSTPTPGARALLIGLSYDQMLDQADLVVLGQVYGSTNHIGGELGVYQLRQVAVERYYKGGGPQNIEVKELGGDVGGGTSLWVEDQPELSVGATYLLFLSQSEGSNYVLGGPQGALKVEDGVAENFSFAFRVTDSGIVPVPADHVSATGFTNNTALVANDPAMLVINYDNGGPAPGYWTFNLRFVGTSGDAAGHTMERQISGFLPFRQLGVYSFYQNFTEAGRYSFSVDGVVLGELDVQPPRRQVTLSRASIPDTLFTGQAFGISVGAAKTNQTGEYRVVARVTPQVKGVESFYESYATCSVGMASEFVFNMVLDEAGIYSITFWQNGVRQLTERMTVLPQNNGPASPDTAAGVEGRETHGPVAASSFGNPPGPYYLILTLSCIIGLVIGIYLISKLMSRSSSRPDV